MGLLVLGIMAGYERGVSASAVDVKRLHEVTERICKGKIESFVSQSRCGSGRPDGYRMDGRTKEEADGFFGRQIWDG